MSRHTLPSKQPNIEIVVGYDRPLKHWFGMVYDHEGIGPLDDEVIIDGWPNKDGLIGPYNFPMHLKGEAERKLKLMLAWLDKQPHDLSRKQWVQLENTMWDEYHGFKDANHSMTWAKEQ